MKKWLIAFGYHWPDRLLNDPECKADNARLTAFLEEGWEPIAVFPDGALARTNFVLRRPA